MNRFKYHFLQEHLLLAHKMEGSLYMLLPDTVFAFISLATVLNTSSVELGFPDGSAGKESACSVGDLGLILGLGRSPGDRIGYPLQHSGLENSMDHGVTKS